MAQVNGWYATFTYYDEFGNIVPADFTAYDYPVTYFTEEQLPTLYKKQYNFAGWFINDVKANIGDSHVPFIPEDSEGDTVTLVAKWEKLYYITDTPLVNLANAVRDLWGIEDKLSLEDIVTRMDIPYEETLIETIDDIQKYKVQIGVTTA